MRKIMLRPVLLSIMLAVFCLGASAQGAPDQIQDALAALNQRLGTNLTLNDFFWTWEQQTFPDSSLGCVQPGITPFPTSVIGYRFLFEYLGQEYEFRVSADRTLTVFCGASVGEGDDDGDVAGTIDNPVQLSNSLCPSPPPDTVYPRTRLAPGIEARVLPGGPNNLRTEPNPAAALIGQIPAGATIQVLQGPACDSQLTLWYQVEFNGQVGYTAEIVGADYFLSPQPPLVDIPRTAPRITITNATALRESAKLQGDFGPGLAWSQTDMLAVTGDAGAEGVWLYVPVGLVGIEPRIIKSLDRFVLATFGSAAAQRDTLVLGSSDGSVHIWDLSPSSTLIERLVLNGHNSAVSAVDISPDGRRVASSGGYAFATTEDPLNENAILIWDIDNITQVFVLRGHTDDVTTVAFSPDGRTIASASLDGSVRFWDAANGTQTARIDSEIPATAMSYSPNGSLLAVGYQDGATLALSLVGGLSAGPVVATHGAPINVISFNADGSLLGSGAADGSLALRAGDRLLTSDTPIMLPAVHRGIVTGIVFSPDGRVLASLGVDNTIRLLTAQGGAEG